MDKKLKNISGTYRTCSKRLETQWCQVAVITATFQKSGRFKSWMAVKNSWP